MDPYDSIEVTDRDGWRKEFPLQKKLVHIGSAPGNDIVLEAWRGANVSPRHLQLILIPGDGQGYRAINLGDTDILVDDSGDQKISPRSAMGIADGECLRVGEFTLVFHFGEHHQRILSDAVGREVASAGVDDEEDTSVIIKVGLSLPQSPLDPENPIEGAITIRNQGNKPGVQFKLEVEGLSPDSYEVGPGPILFPNAEKKVPLRLYHSKGPQPPAGDHRIRIRVTAPEAYPGESASVSRVVRVLPFYDHTLRLVMLD
jgi:hypothetical protein